MDRTMITKQIFCTYRKYRVLLFAILAGVLLMMIPDSGAREETIITETIASAEASLEEKLTELLSHLDGAGQVKVLLTEQRGTETLFQQDENISDKQDAQEIRRDTVIITTADRAQTGLIQRVDPPVYQGAIVLCQGADSPVVKLAVINAVSAVTGLDYTRISVLKMK